ncbi:MAG: AtpZ/AtpI family protein [Actinomycetota bacterium]|nr:AtpZ/AtpI family protein [Actinomycetota bacterium]
MRDKRDLYNGFGNGLSRAFEFAVTPVVFGGLGYALDRRLDLVPVVTIVATLLALAGMFVRMWYGYDAEMKAHEAHGPWGRGR